MLTLTLSMDRIMKLFLLGVIGYLLFVNRAFAQTPCQPIYGGGETCISTGDVTVDSKILNPDTNKFVDNLGVNDAKYKSGFIVTFQILITNNRKTVIKKVNIQNIFPQFVNFSSGPGSFDVNTKKLSFDVDNLTPSETRTFNILGKIAGASQLSFPGNVICLANQVIASVPDPALGQDNTQFCIEKSLPAIASSTTKGGFPVYSSVSVSSSPKTGPEMLGLIALLPTGLIGWFLRKHAVKKNNY